jgi:hypothetical protein
MKSIPTVKLPFVRDDETIGQAIARIQEAGTSAIVVMDERGPVVVTARSLHNTLAASGGERNTPISRVTSRAFPNKKASFLGGASRSVLASEQDAYVVTDFDADSAFVATDPKRAAELGQPFEFTDGLEPKIA